MLDPTAAAWICIALAFVLFVASGLIFEFVKERVPRYVVAITLLVVAMGVALWAILLFRFSEWG